MGWASGDVVFVEVDAVHVACADEAPTPRQPLARDEVNRWILFTYPSILKLSCALLVLLLEVKSTITCHSCFVLRTTLVASTANRKNRSTAAAY